MKPLTRRCCSEEGLLLQVTLLLSLAGLRLDLDLLRRRAPDTSHAGSSPPHPKCPERDWDRLLLLREVRALGGPYIPSTSLDAWLVHAVAGEENGALPSSPVSGAGGDGPSESGAQEGPDHPRSVRGSSLQQQAQEEGDGGVAAAPGAEPSPGGSDCPILEDVDLETGQEALDYYYPHKGSEQSESQEGEEKIKQVNEEENEKKAKPEGEERENTDSSTESNRNSINSFPFLEDYLLLQSSQTENARESIIENTSSTSQSTAGLVRDNFIEEIWQDFLLSPELQLLAPDLVL
ncbi:nuclear factor erythroid 2-related factor 3 isoform X4 [Chrysemys picta bellii]|uniref:nuclear factor erythroid 2-related factor 3 isoform X4 n=1 Tax=Chrysemys picta bellii TaxID=8478 RepID=UPI000CE64D10